MSINSGSQTPSSKSDSASTSAKKATTANTILTTINFGVRMFFDWNSSLCCFVGFIPSSGSIFPYNRGTKYKRRK